MIRNPGLITCKRLTSLTMIECRVCGCTAACERKDATRLAGRSRAHSSRWEDDHTDEYYDDGVHQEKDKGVMLCSGLAKDRSVHVILRPDLPKEMKTKVLTRA